jgi:type I restriction enzyme, S subunit
MSEMVTLGDVLLGIEAGKSFQTSDQPARDHELGVLKVSAVTWTAFRPEEAKAVANYVPDERHRVKANDLLISRANTRELVGAVVLVDRDFPNRLLSDKTLRLIVDAERVDKSYLLFALRSAGARAHIEHFATGTSDSMRNIAQGVISSIPIKLPALARQREIAARLKAELAAVEDARRAAEAQLREIERLPQRLLAQVFDFEGEA